MAKGIIYVMTTVVPGLIKIGKTGVSNFKERMRNLEKNGYSNVTGLKRKFAIEVEEYDEKETLIDEIFSKSKVPNTELYALDVDLAIQLLSSFEGIQVYPENKSKEDTFKTVTEEREAQTDLRYLPDGEYYLSRKVNNFQTDGRAIKKGEKFKVLKGSICAPIISGSIPEIRKNVFIENDILQEDVLCNSPSSAGLIVIGKSNNGWSEWKDKEGRKINFYREKGKAAEKKFRD